MHYAESYGDSYFQAGKSRVNLALPIDLQGGFIENELGEFKFVGTEDGAPVIQPVEQQAETYAQAIDYELLPESEKERYQSYLSRENFFATVELAGSPENIVLNEGNLLIESTETALGFPVKIHLTDKPGSHFLGEDCYIGSNEKPIMVDFVTGQSGSLHGAKGEISSKEEGTILDIKNNILVNNTVLRAWGDGVRRRRRRR